MENVRPSRLYFGAAHSSSNSKFRYMTITNPASTKHLYDICAMLVQRQRRWADVVQMFYICFVFVRNRQLFSKTMDKTIKHHSGVSPIGLLCVEMHVFCCVI